MKVLSRLTAIAVIALFASAGAAFAGLGQPTPWQLGLQDAASPVMDQTLSGSTITCSGSSPPLRSSFSPCS